MKNNKLIGYLNIAKKANYVIIGLDSLSNYKKKLYLILYEDELNKNVEKLLNKFQDRSEIQKIPIKNLDKLININNCKVIGIKNKGLSEVIIENLYRGENN